MISSTIEPADPPSTFATAPLSALAKVKVLDLGAGMAAALVAKMFAEMGASVQRISPCLDDPFDRIYPAHRYWRSGVKDSLSDEFGHLISEADLCIIGGEDFPGVDRPFESRALARMNPNVVILDLVGYLSDAGPAVDILVQARTGFCFEQYQDRPMHFAWPGPTYGAALLGATSALAALVARARGQRGKVVQVSLEQGAAMWWSVFWMSVKTPDDEFCNTVTPKGVRQLIFECADGHFVQFVTRAPGDLAKVYRILGMDDDVDPTASGMANLTAGAENYYGPTARYAAHVRRFRRDNLLESFRQHDIAAEAVLAPGDCWNDSQTLHNGIIRETSDGVCHVGLPLKLRQFEFGQQPPKPVPKVPLEGLRIVDFGHLIAGPYASRLLAELGADVVKVEPLTGDLNRTRYRSHVAASVGKRSICIDAKAPEGLEIINRLVATSAASHHNFRPGVAARLGIEPSALRRVRPGLVTLETTSYGSSGPKAQYPGYDMIMQAYCGLDVRAGGEGNLPAWCRAWIVDYATGALGAIAMLAGLLEQASSGNAVEAQTNLLDSGIFLISELVRASDGSFSGADLSNPEQTGLHPAESLYEARDGWIAVAARSATMSQALAGVLGLELADRASWGETERKRLAKAVKSWDCDNLLSSLKVAGVWAERCVSDGWSEAQARASTTGMIITVKDPRYGDLTCVGSLLGTSTRENQPELRAAPTAGEHTREILVELGYQTADIDDFYLRRVVA